MHNRLILFVTSLITALSCQAQVFPAPGAKLNYTQVMFEYLHIKGADKYLLQVAEDGPTGFAKLVAEQPDSATATLISNLQFGKRYQWRYTAFKGTQQLGWNGPYYFEITEDSFILNK